MADQLTQFKQDLEDLKQRKSHVQIRMEESVSRAKALKETLAEMGYKSLSEAKEAYAAMSSNAAEKHEKVKQLIKDIKEIEGKVPSKDEILKRLREESQTNSTLQSGSVVKDSPKSDTSVKEETKSDVNNSSSDEGSSDGNSGMNTSGDIDMLNGILFGDL